MKFSKEELRNMSFIDEFELEEPGEYEEEDCCIVCGNELENLIIGFNEKEQLYKYECANCDSIYVIPKTQQEMKEYFFKARSGIGQSTYRIH